MTEDEQIDSLKIASIAKRHITKDQLIIKRPFQKPHHSISHIGMTGGGKNPTPGEISLAHNGILFLDELPEFSRQTLEVLRQPLEDQKISISRAGYHIEFPANFILIAAMNPCPCGYATDSIVKCTCQDAQIKKYWQKISGPILDRIDIIIQVPRLNKEEILKPPNQTENPYTSKNIQDRVLTGIQKQQTRQGQNNPNAKLSPYDIQKHCKINIDSKTTLAKAVENGTLTGRSHDHVIRIARTIADIAEEDEIKTQHIYEALQYRKTNMVN